MICCKIVFDYKNTKDIGTLLNILNKSGEFLLDSYGCLYFSNVTDLNFTEESIKKIFSDCQCNNYFISIYSEQASPNEYDDSINGWLYDKIIKINYALCENENQKVFQNISIALDELNKEIDDIEVNEANKK